MIYIIVTTSIFNNCIIRKQQYINAINQLKKCVNNINCKIIIVENNGLRETFLDNLNCEVYYTNNNFLNTKNKGYKELKDVLDTIYKYNIKDNDFIVKITGRYVLKDNSEFINCLKNLNDTNYYCIIKYGSFLKPLNYKTNDCITGLIGMKSFLIKKIIFPKENECVEWKWAEATYLIDETKIHKVNNLDIAICPGSNTYFYV